MMKTFTYIIILIGLVIGCSTKKNQNILLPSITILNKINPYNGLKVDTGRFYNVQVKIYNNSDTVIDYWILSCAWEANWYLENNSFVFLVDCPHNIPVINHIKPHQELCYNANIEFVDSINNLTNKKYRVGFVLIKKDEVHEPIDFGETLVHKIETKTDIFWSDYFDVVLMV